MIQVQASQRTARVQICHSESHPSWSNTCCVECALASKAPCATVAGHVASQGRGLKKCAAESGDHIWSGGLDCPGTPFLEWHHSADGVTSHSSAQLLDYKQNHWMVTSTFQKAEYTGAEGQRALLQSDWSRKAQSQMGWGGNEGQRPTGLHEV